MESARERDSVTDPPDRRVVTPGAEDREYGLFAISVAAELTGLHPQTLRIYEREGLVTPARSDGGTRKYSRADIDRLSDIAQLMADGLNIKGVHEVLQLRHENRELRDRLSGRGPASGPAGSRGSG